METQNRPLSPLGNLERLAIVGTSGMGALTYRPVIPMEHAYDEMTLDEIARECERIPNLDYDLLMRLTLQLTRSMSECEKLFRLMCFNVFAHNRDDHSKNFTYIYREEEARWFLAPAYDLTYSNSIGGEHATTIHGNGTNPGMKDILAVADGIGLNHARAKKIAEEIRECVYSMLGPYL